MVNWSDGYNKFWELWAATSYQIIVHQINSSMIMSLVYIISNRVINVLFIG